MRVIVLGLPHTKTLDPSRSPFTTCAYTVKVWNLCRMMSERGHEVVHLGVEGSGPPYTRHVDVQSDAAWSELYSRRDPRSFYDVRVDGKYASYMRTFAANSVEAVRSLGGDPLTSIVCQTWGPGGAHHEVLRSVRKLQWGVESGIGYPDPTSDFRVYESYAWMHFHLGREGRFDGCRWYHAVIPNAFDPDLFGPVLPADQRDDYALYFGRLLDSKGTHVACRAARAAGLRTIIVGQGDPAPYVKDVPGTEYLPPQGVEQRRQLMRKARVVLCPTQYVEPFGGVAVEAQLSGTPVVTTDWGVFNETVLHGQTGYRCRTFDHFVWAVKNAGTIDPLACREWTEKNFSLDRVGGMYEEYFDMVLRLREETHPGGWGQLNDRRLQLDWLDRHYPGRKQPAP